MFLCIRTPRKLPLKVKKAKRMPLMSRNLKIRYPREKLIPYESPVLWKTQPNLFESCANWTNKQKPFSKQLRLQNSFFIQKLWSSYTKKQLLRYNLVWKQFLAFCSNFHNFEIDMVASSRIQDICMELACFSGTLTSSFLTVRTLFTSACF